MTDYEFMTPDEIANEQHEDFLMEVSRAERKFYDYIATIEPKELRSRIEYDAFANSFTVETYHEYRDDVHRWEVALETAKMYVDIGVENM